MTTTPLRTVPIPDGHLSYLDVGRGHPVVLLHGGALDHRMWAPQIEPLARAHRVVAVDLRGHGGSSTPVAPFRHADDVATLLRRADIGPAVLVGVSLGAGTAVDVAVEHPYLVTGLVISGAGSSDPDFRDPWTLGRLAAWAEAAQRQDRDGWLAIFLELGVGPYRSVAEVDPAVVEQVRTMAQHTLDEHVPDGGPIVGTPPDDIRRRSRGLPIPVRAVVGALDSHDHRRMARKVAEAAVDGDVVTIEGAAHYPNLERPGPFTDAVLGLLAR